MIWLALILAAAPQDMIDLRVPGTFRFAPWEGRCFRDGYLSGYDHEACVAWYRPNGKPAPVMIEFDRLLGGAEVHAKVRNCKADTVVRKLSNAQLAGAGRVTLFAAAVRGAWGEAARNCGVTVPVPVVEMKAVAEMLTESDGLEF